MDSVKKIARAIKNLTAADFYKIYIEPDAKPAIFDSKFGGTPYWTADKAFPVDANGNKMFLLAQINFAAFKFDEPFPSGGILQFFAANEDLLGLDYDNPTAQNILYWIMTMLIAMLLTGLPVLIAYFPVKKYILWYKEEICARFPL